MSSMVSRDGSSPNRGEEAESDPDSYSVEEESEDDNSSDEESADMDIDPDESDISKEDEADLSRNPIPEIEYGALVKLSPQGSLVSIESAKLTIFKDDGQGATSSHEIFKDDGQGATSSHEIYGKIMVTGLYSHVYALYNSKQNEADIIPAGEPRNLRLSGPKFSLETGFTNFIHIRLYENGSSQPLLDDDIFLKDYRLNNKKPPPEPPSVFHNNRKTVSATGERATLQVTFTRFNCCRSFHVSLSPITAQQAPSPVRPHQAPWTVSGTVVAIQRTVKEGVVKEGVVTGYPFESSVTLFDRAVEEGVQVSPRELIPLDRSLVVAPIKKDVDGPSLTIDANLLFKEHGNGNVHKLNGERKFVFRTGDIVELISEPLVLKRQHPDLDCSGAPDKLNVDIFPCYDTLNDMAGEENAYEYEKKWRYSP